MNKIGIVTCGLLLSSSFMFGSQSIDDAFKNGEIEGSLGLYGVSKKFKTQDNDSRNNAYGNGNLTLGYLTGDFYGFSLGAQAKGNLKLGEKHKHDWKDKASFENSALITQAYLQYAMDEMLEIKAGRYEGDLEWFSDYQQGAIVEFSAIPDTVVAIGYSNRKSDSGIDTSEDFYKPTEKGIYVLDIKNKSFENVEFNPYFYKAPKALSFYGLKTTLEVENFELIAHYAKSKSNSDFLNEYDEKIENNSIAHLELNVEIVEDLNASIGFIKTSKKGGAEEMASYGDNISPFEDGEQIYGLNAKTLYAGIEYSIADFDFLALYGVSKYGEDRLKEKELNLGLGYNFTESLNTSFLYVNVDADKEEKYSNYNKYIASVEYKF